MSEKKPLQPVVKKHRGPSMVWLIPIITLCAGALLIAKTISERGPEITITFRSADGIEKKTAIRYKDVKIGVVKKIRFSEDFKHVVLTARMASSAEVFLHEHTRFWVVSPHLSLHGASGLKTLISGSYIEVDPGDGDEQYDFTGLDEAPAITSDTDGLRITLKAKKLGSLDIGAPVYYKGIAAGEVLSYGLSKDEKNVLVHLFIKTPYDKLIHRNSHFWNVSGIEASVDGDGFRLHSPSILAMIFGGISFDSPGSPGSNKDISALTFTLYPTFDDIMESSYTKKNHFITYFNQTLHGLKVGAAVEFQGIKVGSVTDIGLKLGAGKHGFRTPVILEIEPERIPDYKPQDEKQIIQTLKKLVKQGLRAQLQTSSLLTGRLYVALSMHPDDTHPALVNDTHNKMPEIPSIAGGFGQIQESIHNILAKLEKVQTDKIGDEVLNTIQGANKLINMPEFRQTLADLHVSIHAFRHIMEALDKHAEPMADNLNLAIDSGQKALKQAEKTLKSLDRVLDPASPVQYRLNQMSRDISDMARSIRAFVDLLDRHPNAIIVGKPTTGE